MAEYDFGMQSDEALNEEYLRVRIERENLEWVFDIFSYRREERYGGVVYEFYGDQGGVTATMTGLRLSTLHESGEVSVTLPKEFGDELRESVRKNLPER